jgi:hypothetical protein
MSKNVSDPEQRLAFAVKRANAAPNLTQWDRLQLVQTLYLGVKPKNLAAQSLRAIKSDVRAQASRQNGRLGGRPRKVSSEPAPIAPAPPQAV